jgi:hypothetical protein
MPTGQVGRPKEMEGGKRVQAYLDTESLAIANKLGRGNVSNGIRKSLKQAGKMLPENLLPIDAIPIKKCAEERA